MLYLFIRDNLIGTNTEHWLDQVSLKVKFLYVVPKSVFTCLEIIPFLIYFSVFRNSPHFATLVNTEQYFVG